MEEAETLCDRLMILSQGEIRAIGPSADLKNRFGEGFKLSFQVAHDKSDVEADKFVRQLLPSAVLLHHLSGVRHYEVPKKEVKLEQVFEAMEKNKERLFITNWALTNTTLEEVFLHITLGHKVKSNNKELLTEGDLLESNLKKEEEVNPNKEEEVNPNKKEEVNPNKEKEVNPKKEEEDSSEGEFTFFQD